MKTLRHIATFVLVLGQTQLGYAYNMWNYRNGILKQDNATPTTAQNAAYDRVNSLRRQLGTSGISISGLNTVTFGQEKGKDRRFYSSILFKDTLGGVVRKMLDQEQYSTPVIFDPSWSPDHIRIVKEYLKERNCMKAIALEMPARGNVSSMDQLLEQIMYRLVKPRQAALEDSDALSKARVTNTGTSLQSILQSHVNSGPLNSKGQTISAVIGQISNVEIVDGYVHRVDFKKNDSRIRASLHQMITQRSGEDDGFVDLQRCLINYLVSQDTVLKARKAELQQSLLTRAWQATQDKVQDWISKIKSYRSEIINRSNDPAKVASELDNVEVMLNANNPRAQYKAKLKYYLEGKKLSSSELNRFIDTRLSLIKDIVPYLQARSKTADDTNTLMKGLSKEQVSYLTDMFLQLRAGDLPTQGEIALMSVEFRKPVMQASNKGGPKAQNSEADYMFYSVLGAQLTDLERVLTQETALSQAMQNDLNQIRRQ